jgi:hypothetical protein
MENLLFTLGLISLVLMCAAPLVIMPLVWKFLDRNTATRIVTGILLSAVISFLLFCIGLILVVKSIGF